MVQQDFNEQEFALSAGLSPLGFEVLIFAMKHHWFGGDPQPTSLPSTTTLESVYPSSIDSDGPDSNHPKLLLIATVPSISLMIPPVTIMV